MKWASKQKTYRIVKEQAPREATPGSAVMPFESTARSREPSLIGRTPRLDRGHPLGKARVIARRCAPGAWCGVWAGSRSGGGASRDRTGDLLVANQTLSQLSYGPSSSIGQNRSRRFRRTSLRRPRTKSAVSPAPPNGDVPSHLVGLGGVAPPTSPLSGVRSN